jgi:hypothetical protein
MFQQSNRRHKSSRKADLAREKRSLTETSTRGYAEERMFNQPLRYSRGPLLPDKSAFGHQMARNRSKDCRLILRREENLKCVAGEHHKVEALAQPNASGILLNPTDQLASQPLFR